ncbi:Carotenoid 9,10(9',10')-cleavage dioxygenase [Platanthera guangdongensis]|uniref:carotenoid 9,10-dioxygenase n=1 Tax=Platanthera guangdongensis TaxID=2320717 RepID=A0ABR2M3P4_9ASPA
MGGDGGYVGHFGIIVVCAPFRMSTMRCAEATWRDSINKRKKTIGDIKGLFGLFMVQMQLLRAKLKVLDLSYGIGTGNTALIYHHGKLLALSEADKPYVIKVLEDGDLQTLGLLDYDQRLGHSFTAHPKVDPFTDEMFTFGYSHTAPYISYRVITKDGCMLNPVPITIPEPIMMHDFAITENYAIFMDLPLYFRPKEMVKGNLIFMFDPTKKARFGVLPRYAKNELLIRWFELPNCFIFHNGPYDDLGSVWEDLFSPVKRLRPNESDHN